MIARQVVVAVSVVFIWCASAEPSGFQAEGFFRTMVFIPGRPEFSRVLQFRVAASGCEWRIETERVQDSLDEFDVRVESGTSGDGRIYTVSYGRDRGSAKWNPTAGSVRPGPVPHVIQEPGVTVVWVA